MEFLDKLGKKASEAYKVTADKTGKIAKETKLRIKMGELKTKINDLYEEIGKIVYEKHIKKESIDIEKDLIEQCTNIDVMSDEIKSLLKECLELKDKKQCPKCFTGIEKDANFCSNCGIKQDKKENTNNLLKETEQEKSEDLEENKRKSESNLEKTTIIEISPKPNDITDEEVKTIGSDEEDEESKDIK